MKVCTNWSSWRTVIDRLWHKATAIRSDDASVEGAVQLKCEYNYSNWFKAGVRYDGDLHTFSEFEEEENEFTLFEPQLVFSAEAGVGLFLGAEVIIDGVAGPEVAVGPRLGAEASIEVSPRGLDWNAEVNLTVQAVAGIKLKVLGYEIAEWGQDIRHRRSLDAREVPKRRQRAQELMPTMLR